MFRVMSIKDGVVPRTSNSNYDFNRCLCTLQDTGLLTGKVLDESGDDPAPLALGLTKRGKDRIVEIKEDRCRKLAHGAA